MVVIGRRSGNEIEIEMAGGNGQDGIQGLAGVKGRGVGVQQEGIELRLQAPFALSLSSAPLCLLSSRGKPCKKRRANSAVQKRFIHSTELTSYWKMKLLQSWSVFQTDECLAVSFVFGLRGLRRCSR